MNNLIALYTLVIIILNTQTNLNAQSCTGSTLALSGTGTCTSCFGFADGSTDITVTGGELPYTYMWNTGTATEDLSGLTAGIYTVTVTDSFGCTVSDSFVVCEPAEIIVNITGANFCNGCMDSNHVVIPNPLGDLNSNVSGGTGSYSYLWSTGDTTANLTNVPAGNYSLTVTDQNGCTGQGNGALPDLECTPAQIPGDFVFINSGGEAECPDPTQCCQYNANFCKGGELPCYQYDILLEFTPALNIRKQFCASKTEISVAKILADEDDLPEEMILDKFHYIVEDQGGNQEVKWVCASTDTMQIIIFVDNTICPDSSNGSAQAIPFGGTPPISYSWSTGATTQSINGLGVGVYSVTVTDSLGLSVTANATISSEFPDCPAPIPTLSQWAMLFLALITLWLGSLMIYRSYSR